MKRFCAGLLALCLFIACGCSSGSANKNILYVVDGAYNLTPQEFIGFVNQRVEAQDDDTYKTIPEFKVSGEKIEISRGIYVKIETNDGGNITKIEYSWIGRGSETIHIIGFLMGTTIGTLASEDEGNAIIAELDMMNVAKSSYDTYSSANGSIFWYSSVENAKYNFLTIKPDIAG